MIKSSPLEKVRTHMLAQGYDGLFIPMADQFQNEFIPLSERRIEWVSKFTGSWGSLLLLKDKAALFTDGRYTLQAEREVDQAVIEVQPYGFEAIQNWLQKNNKTTLKIAYDPWVQTISQVTSLEKLRAPLGITFEPSSTNLVDDVWHERPLPLKPKAFLYDSAYAGLSSLEKRTKMVQPSPFFIADPASMCWLLNLRGLDLPYTPFLLCYGILHPDASIDVFVDPEKITLEIRQHFKDSVRFHALEDLPKVLEHIKNSVVCDPNETPSILTSLFHKLNITPIFKPNPCLLAKACRTEIETKNTRQAHLWDGVALTKFLQWIACEGPKGTITEWEAAQKLNSFRYENPHLKSLSFPTISGADENSAVIHYHPSENHSKLLKAGSMYLVDSGGQYLEGTTDVTRVLSIGGTPTPKQKEIFTRVLKGVIALAQARFPKGTLGTQLDILGRLSLWHAGFDYAHSTGHGVGHYMNVHEGPQNISGRILNVALCPGMVVSNEPGCYIENEFGVRLENLMIVQNTLKKDDKGRELYAFETLTLAPFDQHLLDLSLLTSSELTWINHYHQKVQEKVSPFLEGKVKEWLKEVTFPITHHFKYY